MKQQASSKPIYFLIVFLVFAGLSSCGSRDDGPKPVVAFQTGPVSFMALGGVVNTFSVFFDELGDEPIEEYGIVYTFDEDVKDNYPDLTDKKVVFDLPAKQYTNEKTVNIGLPVGIRAFGYRAYVKLKGSDVRYAPPQITYF
nr:hypothetical protein [uncultured Dyadobacter sp.]